MTARARPWCRTQTVTFDVGSKTYTEQEASKPAQISQVTGFEALKRGRGELILLGRGMDNNKPAETRTTLSRSTGTC